MATTPRRTYQEYLDAAVEHLDRHGTADASLGYTMAAAAELAGVTRTTVYRHWETATDFTADLVRHIVMDRSGWQQRLLDLDPAQEGIREAFRVATDGRDFAPLVRAVVAGWPSTSSVREEVAIWERAELERLANWLDASALAMGRGFPDGLDAGDAAVLLASVFEGVYLLTAWVQGPGLADWESLRGEDSAGVAEAWIEHLFPLTTDEPRPSVRPAPPPEFRRPAMGAAKLRVLTAVADAASRPTDPNPDGPTPGRVVDLARLARSLGVTERRLYAVWPTTTAFNADVLDVVVRRAGAEADAFVSRAVEVCMAERFATYDHLMVSAFAGTIEACLSREPNPQFAIMLAFADSEVREPSVAVLLQWVQRLATSLLAVLGTAGMRPVDGLSLEQIGFGVFAMVLGLERMGALHPHLATATRTFDGREVPLLALLAYHGLRRNLTDAPLVPIPPDIANPAPPIDHL